MHDTTFEFLAFCKSNEEDLNADYSWYPRVVIRAVHGPWLGPTSLNVTLDDRIVYNLQIPVVKLGNSSWEAFGSYTFASLAFEENVDDLFYKQHQVGIRFSNMGVR